MNPLTNTRALVIGYGSAGRRHSRILEQLGCRVQVVTSCGDCPFPVFRSTQEALRESAIDYAVVCNRTSEHFDTMVSLRRLGYTGVILTEKPLLDRPAALPHGIRPVYAAYNLRYHPVLQRLAQLLESDTATSVMVYTGQYLPAWREGDYRERYSAKRREGGGVLRDLSHELDYVQWLFGTWRRVVSLGGRLSDLDIDSDDTFALLLAADRCPVVTIQINYLDRINQRKMIVNTTRHTYAADLVAQTLQIDDRLETFPHERDHTYRQQHLDLLSGNRETICTLEQALGTMSLIWQTEQSASCERWMNYETSVHHLCTGRIERDQA